MDQRVCTGHNEKSFALIHMVFSFIFTGFVQVREIREKLRFSPQSGKVMENLGTFYKVWKKNDLTEKVREKKRVICSSGSFLIKIVLDEKRSFYF